MIGRRLRWGLFVGVLVVASFAFLFVGSVNAMIDREVRAHMAREGMHVDELIREVGLPASDEPVTQGDKLDLWSSDIRNVRAIGYEFPDRGLVKTVWDWISRLPSSGVVVCLDESNRVTATHFYQN